MLDVYVEFRLPGFMRTIVRWAGDPFAPRPDTARVPPCSLRSTALPSQLPPQPEAGLLRAAGSPEEED